MCFARTDRSFAHRCRRRNYAAGRRRSTPLRPVRTDEYKTARVIGRLQTAQDLHRIVNLAPGGGPARFEVLLTQNITHSNGALGSDGLASVGPA